MATAKIEVPHVIRAMSKVLAALSVEKGGTLPNNMGGKSYVTAQDLTEEVKRQFVENGLIMTSRETFQDIERLVNNGRTQISIVVSVEADVISVEDGSSVTIGGVGDGLAIGTAVASNIASTNATKNMLLRALLITEQSSEDNAKKGVEGNQGEPARVTQAESKISKARQPRETPPQESDTPNYRALIKGMIDSGAVTPDKVNARWAEIATELDKPKGDASVMEKLYKEIK